MDILLFRSHKNKMLSQKSEEVQSEANRRIQLVLDLLGTEVMSVEGLAIIISQVQSELTTPDKE